MNKYLMAGTDTPENQLLVLEEAQDALRAVANQSLNWITGSIRQSILDAKKDIQTTGFVSRQHLSMLELSVPEALNGLPMTMWTAVPSATNVKLALESLDNGLNQLDGADARQALEYACQSLGAEITHIEQSGDTADQALRSMLDLATKVVTKITECNRDELQEAMNHAFHQLLESDDPIANEFRRTNNSIIRFVVEYAQQVEAVNLGAIGESAQRMLQTLDQTSKVDRQAEKFDLVHWQAGIKEVANSIGGETVIAPDYANLPFITTDCSVTGYAATIEAKMTPETYDYPLGFLQAARTFFEFTLPALLEGAIKANNLRRSNLALVESVKGNLEYLQKQLGPDCRLEEHASKYLRELAYLQKARCELHEVCVTLAMTFLAHAGAMAQVIEYCEKQARENDAETFWDRTDSEVEAADGYTEESAWEAVRRGIEYALNMLKRLADWLTKSWKTGSNRAAVMQAEANNNILARANDAVVTDNVREQFTKLTSKGISTIGAYATGGNVWSGAYKGVADNLTGAATLLKQSFQQASRGETIADDAVAKLKDTLLAAYEKAGFDKVLLDVKGVTLDSVASDMAEYRKAVKASFGQPGDGRITLDVIKGSNEACRAFLAGPVTDARTKVSGHELDSLITQLNSMVRQQASNPNNEQLGRLKEVLVTMRNLTKAAVDVLGLCMFLEKQAKRYIGAVGKLVDAQGNADPESNKGDLKQEAFTPVPELMMFGNDLYSQVVDRLSVSTFTTTQEQRLFYYTKAIQFSVQWLYSMQQRRAAIQNQLLGLSFQFEDQPDVPFWTLGMELQTTDALDSLLEQLAQSYNNFLDGTRVTDVCFDHLAPHALAKAVDPNHDEDLRPPAWFSFYRNLGVVSTEEHRDFTDAGQRKAWLAGFVVNNTEPKFGFFDNPPPILNVIPNGELLKQLQAYAMMFCAAMDAYIQLRYGNDHRIYQYLVENIKR